MTYRSEAPTKELPSVDANEYRFSRHWDELKRRARLKDDTCAEVELRLIAGDAEYGDKSWGMTKNGLTNEICQELYDVIGWSVLLSPKMDEEQRQELAEICKVAELLIGRLGDKAMG